MIDPVEFGRLQGEVRGIKTQIEALNTASASRIKELSDKIDALTELANKGKGAMWVGMGFAAFFSSLVTAVAGKLIVFK